MAKPREIEFDMIAAYREIVNSEDVARLREIYKKAGHISSIGCPEHLPLIEEFEDTDLDNLNQDSLTDRELVKRLVKNMRTTQLCKVCRLLRAAVAEKMELLLGSLDE